MRIQAPLQPHPLLSIVLPAYSVGPWVRLLLEALSAQSFPDWECIAVDDGSADETGELLEAHLRKDGRFRVIHQRNGGVSRARNRALAVATGDYVCFADGDDLLSPDWLEGFARAIDETHADLIQARMYFWKGGALPKAEAASFSARRLCDIPGNERVYAQLFLKTAYPFLYCLRRKVLGDGRFNPSLTVNEDNFFFLSLLPSLKTFATCDSRGYFYRQREGSALHQRRQAASVIAVYRAFQQMWLTKLQHFHLSSPDQTQIAQAISTFCWGSFMDWVQDAHLASSEERCEMRKALGALFRLPFWDAHTINRKYLWLHLVPLALFLRCGYYVPLLLLVRTIRGIKHALGKDTPCSLRKCSRYGRVVACFL